MSAVLELVSLNKGFGLDCDQPRDLDSTFDGLILNNLNWELSQGKIIAIVGRSGSGKSTLLHIAGLLEEPDSGDVVIMGRSSRKLSDDERTAMRRDNIAFVYQFHHLLAEFDVIENIMMPQLIRGVKKKEAEKIAVSLLEKVGLAEKARQNVQTLSGGEQQRVAVLRALAADVGIVLADEPTGNLDEQNSAIVFDLLAEYARSRGKAVVIVTHSREIAERCDEAWILAGGILTKG